MTAKNDITGDAIRSKSNTDAYRDNYDRIFRKKKEEVVEEQVDTKEGVVLELEPMTAVSPQNRASGQGMF